MPFYTLQTTKQLTHYILLTSDIDYNNPYIKNYNTPNPSHFLPNRLQSQLGTDSYSRSLRRAFSRAKQLAFFNPDLTQFITLTYKANQTDLQQALLDIQILIKYQKRLIEKQTKTTKTPTFKYIYVFELQKRGAIHVHMVANDFLATKMVNGRLNVLGWQQHGFSDVKTIKNTDNNFKPYLYLFKYMQKAQRIGGSFIHVSRNFDKISSMDYSHYINTLSEVHLLYKEDYEFTINDKTRKITKEYLRNVGES